MIAMLVAAMGFAQFQKMETSPFKKQVIYKQTRAANGIALTSVTPAEGATVEAGNITISGVVTNNGDENLTSYKVSYKVDEEDAVEYAVSEIEVASGETHNFTHPTPAVLAAGEHSIVVTVSEPNGDTEFEAVSQTVNVTATEPVQDVVEIALTSVTPEDNATVTAGDVTITGVVTNNGNVALTEFKVSYQVNDAAPVVTTINDINVAAEGTHTFTLTVALEAAENPYTIVVTVSEPNGVADGDDTNNSKTIHLTATEPVPPAAVAITLAVNPTAANATVGEDITITGTVTNTGTDALTTYKFSYAVDGGEAVDSTVTELNIATEGTHEFTFTVAAFAEAGAHSIVVTVSEPNGDTEFEALTQTINVTVSEPVVQPAVAITLAVNPTAANATVGENITITGTVTNTGTDALTIYKFSYAIDTLAPVDSTVTGLNIVTDSTHVFTFTTAFAEAGEHSIVVTVSEPNENTEFAALTQTVNVTVSEPVQEIVEIALTSVTPENNATVIAGDVTINGVVRNNGNVALSSYKVSYTVDNAEPVVSTVTIDEAVAAAGTHTFTLTVAVEAGAHTIVIAVSEPNGEEDGDDTNNSKTITINAVDCSEAHTAPWTETFNANSTSIFCWGIIDGNEDDTYFEPISVSEEDENERVMYLSYAELQEDYLVSPMLAVTENNLAMFKVAHYAYYGTPYPETYEVYVIAGGEETKVKNATATTALFPEFENVSIDLSAYAGRNIQVAIKCISDDAYYFFVDDFSLIVAPSTPEIALTSVTPANGKSIMLGQSINIGGVVTNNGATLTSYNVSYTVDGGEAVEYDVTGINVPFYGTHNFTHATPILLETAGAHSIVVTISNPNGTADDASDNSQTINVNVIDCSAPISDFPYVEGFENGIPACWTFIDADGDGYNWVAGSACEGIYLNGDLTGSGNNSSQDMLVSGSFSNVSGEALTPDNWAITPAISLPSNSTAELSFFAAAQDASYPAEHYGVYVSTTTTDPSAFTLIWEENMNANGGNHRAQGAWGEKHTDLSDYAGQTIYIGFRHFNCTDQFLFLIDDVTIALVGAAEENIAESIAVYPNPTSSMVTIANAEGKDIVIVNSLGQVVANIENAAANQTIDVANFANGTYFVKVDGEVVKLNVVK